MCSSTLPGVGFYTEGLHSRWRSSGRVRVPFRRLRAGSARTMAYAMAPRRASVSLWGRLSGLGFCSEATVPGFLPNSRSKPSQTSYS